MGERIRVLSANLWEGRVDPAGLAELLERHAVDVAAVQELGPAQADVLGRMLPHGRLDVRPDLLGMGIALARPAELSRIPLAERDAHRARLAPTDWPGLRAPLELLNVHVRAPHVFPLGHSRRLRARQLGGLQRYLDARGDAAGPLLLVGDLNATPAWAVYRGLASRLDDAAHAVARRRGTAPRRTWAPFPWLPRLFRIDHAFQRGLAVESVEVVPLPGGDHSALVVDLEA